LPATIGNLVWNDADQDGIQVAGEKGVAGVTVELISDSFIVLNTTTTDASGNFQFTVNPGNYRLRFVPPVDSAYSFTRKNQGFNDAIDSDTDFLGITELVTLAAGQSKNDVDAGLVFSGNDISFCGDAAEATFYDRIRIKADGNYEWYQGPPIATMRAIIDIRQSTTVSGTVTQAFVIFTADSRTGGTNHHSTQSMLRNSTLEAVALVTPVPTSFESSQPLQIASPEHAELSYQIVQPAPAGSQTPFTNKAIIWAKMLGSHQTRYGQMVLIAWSFDTTVFPCTANVTVEQLEYGWNYDTRNGRTYDGPPNTPKVGPYDHGQEIKPIASAIETIIANNDEFNGTME
jgi:hypothetical protein